MGDNHKSMMLSFQVEDMRRTVQRLLHGDPRRIVKVMILKEHADYLGVAYTQPKQNDKPSKVRQYPGQPGKPYGSLVYVKLAELFVALKEAKGVDEQDIITSGEGINPA